MLLIRQSKLALFLESDAFDRTLDGRKAGASVDRKVRHFPLLAKFKYIPNCIVASQRSTTTRPNRLHRFSTHLTESAICKTWSRIQRNKVIKNLCTKSLGQSEGQRGFGLETFECASHGKRGKGKEKEEDGGGVSKRRQSTATVRGDRPAAHSVLARCRFTGEALEEGIDNEVAAGGPVARIRGEAAVDEGTHLVADVVGDRRWLCGSGDLEDQRQMVGESVRMPRRFCGDHLDAHTAQRPNVTSPPVAFSTQNFGRHESDRPEHLTLEFPGTSHLRMKEASVEKILLFKPAR